jgi:hypothetical protein
MKGVSVMDNQELNESFQRVSEALEATVNDLARMITSVFVPVIEDSIQVVSSFVESISTIDWSAGRDPMDDMNIANGHWAEVSPEAFDRITPEQRWEYQKWVWGAPKRWVSDLYERLR